MLSWYYRQFGAISVSFELDYPKRTRTWRVEKGELVAGNDRARFAPARNDGASKRGIFNVRVARNDRAHAACQRARPHPSRAAVFFASTARDASNHRPLQKFRVTHTHTHTQSPSLPEWESVCERQQRIARRRAGRAGRVRGVTPSNRCMHAHAFALVTWRRSRAEAYALPLGLSAPAPPAGQLPRASGNATQPRAY